MSCHGCMASKLTKETAPARGDYRKKEGVVTYVQKGFSLAGILRIMVYVN